MFVGLFVGLFVCLVSFLFFSLLFKLFLFSPAHTATRHAIQLKPNQFKVSDGALLLLFCFVSCCCFCFFPLERARAGLFAE